MKHGPLLFLGLLFAMALSWLGMIATPQFQIGSEQPTNVPPTNVLYPTAAPGMAQLGRDVYRANGCAYCHTQVVRQDGVRLDVVLTSPGTNQPAVVDALTRLKRNLTRAEAQTMLASVPQTLLSVADMPAASQAQKALSDAGAEANVRVIPIGPDIARGWGTRLTVAQDYLFDTPLMLGSTRIGPDLTNVGLRQPDPTWHLVHLFDPRLKVPGSTMPRYPFLFEKRPRGRHVASGALPIPGENEVFPTREARALAAYLVSLSAEMPLFEAPAPQVQTAAAGAGETNQPAATGTLTNPPAGSVATNNPAADQAAPK